MKNIEVNNKIIFSVITVSLIGFLLILGVSPIDFIPAGERGVMETLGSVDKGVYQSGVVLKIPLISKLIKYSIRQVTYEDKLSAYSSDLQTMEISFKVLYKLPESQLVNLYKGYSGSPVENLLLPKLENELKQAISQYPAEEVVKYRDKVINMAISHLRKSLDTPSGTLIEVTDIPITNIDLSDELENAIEKKQVKQQEALAQKYELEKAQKQAEIAIVTAQAEATSVKIKGEAIGKNPKIIQLELVKKWNGETPTTVVTSAGANILLPSIKE